MTVSECAGSKQHSCLTKHSGTRRKGGLSAVPQRQSVRAQVRGSALPASAAFPTQGRFVRGCNICTPGSRSTSVSRSSARPSGLSAHQDTASAQQVYLVLRSDDRGMSRSAHVRLDHGLAAGLALLPERAPAAPRFQAPLAPFGSSGLRPTLSHTTSGSMMLIGQVQPRFKLVVAPIGIDDQGLGALGGGIAGGLPDRDAPSARSSRGSARPWRLAAFSSCRFRS